MDVSNLFDDDVAPPPPAARMPTMTKKAIKESNKAHDEAVQNERIKESARKIGKQIIADARGLGYSSWDDVEENHPGFIVPGIFHTRPYSHTALADLVAAFVDGSVEQVAAEKAAPEVRTEVLVTAEKIYGDIRLRPRQNKCMDMLVNGILQGRSKAYYVAIPAGAGKSIICAALTKWMQDTKPPCLSKIPYGRFLFVTKKPIITKTERTYRRMGVEKVGTDVQFVSFPALSSKAWASKFEEREVTVFGNKTKELFYIGKPFSVIVIDEGQVCKRFNKRAAQRIWAIKKACPDTIWIWTSATPAVVMNDLMLFALTAELKHLGMPITRETWAAFACQFSGTDEEGKRIPLTEPDTGAFKRFADHIGSDVWLRPPGDKRKFKVTTRNVLLTMTDPKAMKIYYEAEKLYIEACERAGEDKDAEQMQMARFIILRAAEEMVKVPFWVDKMLDSRKRGKQPMAAVCFVQTAIDIAVKLMETGVPRERICMIFGGHKKVKLTDLLSNEEWAAIFAKRMNKEPLTADEKRRWRITNEYRTQRLRRDETAEEQAIREEKLARWNLKRGTDAQQQLEIDEWQEGKRWFCIYTFGRGGTGIDLDDQFGTAPNCPRELFSTICYYGEELVQSAGRPVREGTQTDVLIEFLFFAATIAAAHVAPILLRKLRAIQTLSNAAVDLVEDLSALIKSGKTNVPEPEPAEQTLADDGGDSVLMDEALATALDDDDEADKADGEADEETVELKQD